MISRVKEEAFIFLLTVQFMTRLPVPVASAYTPERFAAGIRYYPAVGILIGAIAAAIYFAALQVFAPLIAVLLSTVCALLFTGAFHEDGLADTFDGIGGGTTAEHALEIMKDSRIGVFGMLALSLVLATKVTAITMLTPSAALIVLVAGHGLSRLSSVIVIASSRYLRFEGTGKPTAEGIGAIGLTVALLTGLFCLALLYLMLSPVASFCALAGLVSGHILIRLFFERKLGGYTGDCLGATQQVSEVSVYLGLLACQ